MSRSYNRIASDFTTRHDGLISRDLSRSESHAPRYLSRPLPEISFRGQYFYLSRLRFSCNKMHALNACTHEKKISLSLSCYSLKTKIKTLKVFQKMFFFICINKNLWYHAIHEWVTDPFQACWLVSVYNSSKSLFSLLILFDMTWEFDMILIYDHKTIRHF